MTKKQNTILVWILVWAGLLIVVLYSPIGSPDFYSAAGNYYVANQPVTVKSGSILNSPKTNSEVASNSDELIIPDVSLTSKPGTSVGSYQPGNGSMSGSGGSSYGSMQTQSFQNTNAGSVGTSGGGTFIASGSSRSSAGSSGIIMTNGIATLSTTSSVNNVNPRQGITNADPIPPSTGGTDPGNDPDLGTQIPVGDGWGLLGLFGMCYVAYKKRGVIGKEIKKVIVH